MQILVTGATGHAVSAAYAHASASDTRLYSFDLQAIADETPKSGLPTTYASPNRAGKKGPRRNSRPTPKSLEPQLWAIPSLRLIALGGLYCMGRCTRAAWDTNSSRSG
jgi:hypothetical protein